MMTDLYNLKKEKRVDEGVMRRGRGWGGGGGGGGLRWAAAGGVGRVPRRFHP